jgi:hypothetical protein
MAGVFRIDPKLSCESALYAFHRLLAAYAKHGGGAGPQPTESYGIGAKGADPEFPVVDALYGGLDFLHKLVIAVMNRVAQNLVALMRGHIRYIHGVVWTVIGKLRIGCIAALQKSSHVFFQHFPEIFQSVFVHLQSFPALEDLCCASAFPIMPNSCYIRMSGK